MTTHADMNDKDNLLNYPFLKLFFGHFDKLLQIKHLLPLVEWVNLVSDKLSHRMKRDVAMHNTIAQFIDDCIRKDAMQGAFKKFEDAWNSIS